MYLLAAGSFTNRTPFLTKYINKRLTLSVFIIQSEEKQRNSIGFLTNIKIIFLIWNSKYKWAIRFSDKYNLRFQDRSFDVKLLLKLEILLEDELLLEVKLIFKLEWLIKVKLILEVDLLFELELLLEVELREVDFEFLLEIELLFDLELLLEVKLLSEVELLFDLELLLEVELLFDLELSLEV